MILYPSHNPVVSVLMSAYNAEAYVNTAIESILNQTFKDFEFIIINDGSTDRTKELLESHIDRRISRINQSNTGLTKALNRGLSVARGEYIARIDADDIAKPERLEKQVAFLLENRETALVGSSCEGIDKHGTVIWTNSLPTTNAQIKWRLLFHNCIPHSTVMFRRDAILALGGYNESISYAQDYDLWLRVAEKYRIANAQEPLTSYRIPMEGTISHDHADTQQHIAQQIQLRFFKKLNSALAERYDEIMELEKFLFFEGGLRDLGAAARLLEDIFQVFCLSSLAQHTSPRELQAVLIEPYTKLAWAYYERGLKNKFAYYLHRAMDSGFQGIFETPGLNLQAVEASVTGAMEIYYNGIKDARLVRQKKETIISQQCLYFAWRYYAAGDMKGFRRAVLRAFSLERSVRNLSLLLKSFLGKRCMDAMHSMKQSLGAF
jgi:glycosyltransferase involved in cell wall biosynthesis